MSEEGTAAIHFGTSGWRAVLAEEFTFANARLVCQAIVTHLLKEGEVVEASKEQRHPAGAHAESPGDIGVSYPLAQQLDELILRRPAARPFYRSHDAFFYPFGRP